MRKATLIATTILALSLSDLLAASAQELVDGTVTKIDEPAGKITLKHGPIKKLEMDEGMTMVFRAQDPAMLKTVKVGRLRKVTPEAIDALIASLTE